MVDISSVTSPSSINGFLSVPNESLSYSNWGTLNFEDAHTSVQEKGAPRQNDWHELIPLAWLWVFSPAHLDDGSDSGCLC